MSEHKLELGEIRKELPFNIRDGCQDKLSYLAEEHYGDKIDFDVYLPSKKKNLQRPYCWTDLQKQELIISVLKGIKLEPISIIIYKDDILRKDNAQIIKIIDGKQRLSTLIDFYKNGFPIKVNGHEYYYKDLSDGGDKYYLGAQYQISDLILRDRRVYEYPDRMISDDDKIAWFEMINFAGTPQDIKHLQNLKK